MKPTVMICCQCKRVNRFGEFVTLDRQSQYELDSMDKHVRYTYCPMCEVSRNTNRLLPVEDS